MDLENDLRRTNTMQYYWLTVSAYTLVLIGSVVVFLFSGAISNSEVGLSVGIAVG